MDDVKRRLVTQGRLRPVSRDDLLAAAAVEPNPDEPAGPFLRAVRAFLAADTPANEAALREAATAGGGDADTIIANLREK
jgi:hypothetical protein